MFADDTKIWAKIKDNGDSDLLQQDLNMLMEWSKQWLLAFNTEVQSHAHWSRTANGVHHVRWEMYNSVGD